MDCGSLEGSVGSFDDCWVDFSGACLDELDLLIEESSVLSSVMFIRLSVASVSDVSSRVELSDLA